MLLKRPLRSALLPLIVLPLLLASCSTTSPGSLPNLPVAPTPVLRPALEQSARLPRPIPPECLPTCSENWSAELASMHSKLTGAATPSKSASAPTK